MDEMLNIALWIMITFVTVSGVVVWMNIQPDLPNGFALPGYVQDNTANNVSTLASTTCGDASFANIPFYAWCQIVKVLDLLGNVTSWIWNLLTGWTNLIQAIFSPLGLGVGQPGALFVGLLIPFLSIVEVGAVLVLLMRVANIIAQVIP
jgi:hypothetical protein